MDSGPNEDMSAATTRGADALDRLYGNAKVVDEVRGIAPDLADWIISFGYGTAWQRESIEAVTRQLITVGMLTVMGGCEAQIKVHARGALRVGATPAQVIDAILHAVPFGGFPRSINALMALKEIEAFRNPAES